MKRIDIVKQDKEWVGKTRDGSAVARGRTKDEAVKKTAAVAKKDPEPVTVKIHKTDGKIGEERTYPRKADPRGSKG